MRELSLFTGAGGGLLGTHGLLGWQCVGAVEWEEYPVRVLRQRQLDGILPGFPIWHMDIREFNARVANVYAGMVDVISAGFPCQPFSVAGKQRGADDERNMWPATLDAIRIIRPRFAFLENVPGLVTSGYFGAILGGLAESGYDARWRILSAAEVGAPHQRDRLWIVAKSTIRERYTGAEESGTLRDLPEHGEKPDHTDGPSGRVDVAHANQARAVRRRELQERGEGKGAVADAAGSGREPQGRGLRQGGQAEQRRGRSEHSRQPHRPSWWQAEPDVGRVVDGLPARVDRLKALGNGQVPLVAATAWRLLTEDLT